jgi:RNA polymerase sigma-70 factor (ECF subfamily)
MRHGAEPDWQEQLYRDKAAELILYGRALGLSHNEAEDIVQELSQTLLTKDAPPDQPAHYLVRSFRNRAFNHRQTLWRRLTRELESRRWFERESAASQEEDSAVRCLESLPPLQREVIVLKIWHDLTFDEIGTLLDVSPHTAAGRYRYGLEKLRACLKGKPHEDDQRTQPTGNPVSFLETAPPVGKA